MLESGTIVSLTNHINVMKRTCRSVLNPQANLDLVHGSLGLINEFFELKEAVHKKDVINIKEEIGDSVWYICCMLNGLDLTFEDLEIAAPDVFIPAGDLAALKIAGVQHNDAIAGLSDTVKAYLMYNRTYTLEHWVFLIKEVLIAISVVAKVFGITMEEIMAANKAKLEARYPEKFSEECANNRDLSKEHKALVGE